MISKARIDILLDAFYDAEPQLVKDMLKATVVEGCKYLDVPFHTSTTFVRWNVKQQRFDAMKVKYYKGGRTFEQAIILNKTREYLKR